MSENLLKAGVSVAPNAVSLILERDINNHFSGYVAVIQCQEYRATPDCKKISRCWQALVYRIASDVDSVYETALFELQSFD